MTVRPCRTCGQIASRDRTQCARCITNTRRHGDPLGINPRTTIKLPWAPIVDWFTTNHPDATPGQICDLLGVDHNQIHRWKTGGIQIHDADRIATTRLHTLPELIWGRTFLADLTETVDA
jgi:hypothetical protein